ncbi:chromatin assembly factor 1 subunit B isoform X2 [Epargyreus clarus]|uniref:chromatin assembly factor 1 subunit B isoform X2 n=1 Tax=Epargyreus clarus TaxID=520877 RepID=UPI003C2CD8A1
MKFAIPEISWHNRDPVLSVDFQPQSDPAGPLRLASGGTDSHVLIWYISTTDTGSVNLEVAADLTRHLKAVNVVRWSPSGQYLASGDDESIIFIWKQKTEESAPTAELGEEVYKESWVIHKTLRGHMEDILDLCWSTDSCHLASGSVDNKLLLWDVGRAKYTCILSDHKGFVQGVAWDPSGQFIATTSSDRVFRTFDVSTKKVTSRSSKAVLPFPKEHPLHDIKVRLYHDDTLQTFYRRLQFSPDGLLIAVPAGRIEPEQGKLDMKPINAVYIYTRYSLKVPFCVVPTAEPALVVRWSPRRYAPRGAGPPAAVPLPRRLVLAVATKRCVLLYDTQQRAPLALVSNVHYTRLTDLTWSPDGRMLVASSTDGFCSVITFGEGELGEVLPDDVEEKKAPVEEPQTDAKETADEPKVTSSTPKIDSFMKFKAPTEKVEKSPKRRKSEPVHQKTPVKIDVLMETAMPSWSDNSSNEIIKPQESEPMEVDKNNEIMVIEDSEDIKLVYEDTENKSQSPKDVSIKASKECSSNESSNERANTAQTEDKTDDKTQKEQSPKLKTLASKPDENDFMKQAKVTDVKQPALQSLPSPRPPRRVNFITLSSPKNKKK